MSIIKVLKVVQCCSNENVWRVKRRRRNKKEYLWDPDNKIRELKTKRIETDLYDTYNKVGKGQTVLASAFEQMRSFLNIC